MRSSSIKAFRIIRSFFVMVFLLEIFSAHAQQINIPRVEQMPNLPQPYHMRDWKKVALGYDSLIFDLNRNGQYLPLIWTDNGGINYPNHPRFGLHSYVGTNAPFSAEAVNQLPALISASLVGIDKSNQSGANWALMAEEFFNRRPEENVYLNNFVSSSGSDWWYDVMPNVFFYQLYDLYPNTGDFAFQFTTVAERWLEAVQKMGGSVTPWKKPNMNYRAWKLATMKANTGSPTEPESAGSIAWILYHAYLKTGLEKYRIGAEWAMEFLNSRTTNPSYELQLPYGVYIAARMNAELGANYDIEKMLNWCFDPEENVREWGVTLGNWGGYDCYGLVGEAKYDGYAFFMNGVEMVGALLPMLRYDDRFARALGKWTLNCANASRLFYSQFLPDDRQDSEVWSKQYDPNSYIAYEAMREKALFTEVSPYATGDAIRGEWAATNFALYGASHAGILGGIIDTTNVQGILHLDLLKTDYFKSESYPTFLLYNPYLTQQTVILDVGAEWLDIYDAVSNNFLDNGVKGEVNIVIPADEAVLLALTPEGGSVDFDYNRMLIDGVVVDYNAGQSVANNPPRLKSLATAQYSVVRNESATLYCAAEDRDGDFLQYQWQADGGQISGSGGQVTWQAPDQAGLFNITSVVNDGKGLQDSAVLRIEVLSNHKPTILSIILNPPEIERLQTTEVTCNATDADGDSLVYIWSAAFGRFAGSGSKVFWRAPDSVGYFYLRCRVDDLQGGSVEDSVAVTVGRLVGDYRFAGDASDNSGFNHHGSVHGAALTEDRFGNPNQAYYFDGVNDFIEVATDPSLNFQNEITVHFWMKATQLFADREAYPLSHGNWENRWKVSITNGGIRWTVKSTTGIKDLDSKTKLSKDVYYCVACTYNSVDFKIYMNGQPDNSSTFSGKILPTSINLTIGQVLPNNSGYNFKGVLDDVRLYNRALTADEVKALYDSTTSLDNEQASALPSASILYQNYPNPFNPATSIRFELAETGFVTLQIYDVRGQLVETLINEQRRAGVYLVHWNSDQISSGVYFYRLTSGKFSQVKKCIRLK